MLSRDQASRNGANAVVHDGYSSVRAENAAEAARQHRQRVDSSTVVRDPASYDRRRLLRERSRRLRQRPSAAGDRTLIWSTTVART